MVYLIDAVKSSYILLNYRAHKSARFRDGLNDQKIYTISLPYLKNTLGLKPFDVLIVLTVG
jgi:hypothetical protein